MTYVTFIFEYLIFIKSERLNYLKPYKQPNFIQFGSAMIIIKPFRTLLFPHRLGGDDRKKLCNRVYKTCCNLMQKSDINNQTSIKYLKNI